MLGDVRWFAVLAFVPVIACAASPPPEPVAAPLPPAPIEVATVPAPPAPDTTALKAKAEEAVDAAARKLEAIGQTCAKDWLETDVACPASEFTQIATDYQAYYAERPDLRKESGSYYSLPRLGGPTRTVEQVTNDLVMGCEDGCRAQRSASIGSALDDAVEACKKAKSGHASCKELEKRLSKNVRASEVERWEGTCESRCDSHRAEIAYAAEVDRKRPKTSAERAQCEAACHRQHDGGWCGTGIMTCLGRCVPKK